MSEKRLSMVDTGQFEDTAIIQDDDKVLVMRAVIASEIVQQYQDSRTGKPFFAYKSADELEKAAWTADGRWVKVLAHPKSSSLDSVEDVNGKMMNPVFRKDLNDPKANRPCRRGIQVDVAWFKDRTPKEVIDRARRMEIKENGEPGIGAKFTLTIPKLNKSGKENFQFLSTKSANKQSIGD